MCNFKLILCKKFGMNIQEIKKKLEYYCSYQERCHEEVYSKLFEYAIDEDQKNQIIVNLITDNFLNEERFVFAFVSGKFSIKKYGKIRIKQELKKRKISNYLIDKGLKSINQNQYLETFEALAEKKWNNLTENNILKKKQKTASYLLLKGWESSLVYEFLSEK